MQHGSLPRGIRISEQRNGQGKNQVGGGIKSSSKLCLLCGQTNFEFRFFQHFVHQEDRAKEYAHNVKSEGILL